MKKYFLIVYISTAALALQAQNASSGNDTLALSLNQCIEFALKNNSAVKNTTLDEEIAAARVREIRGIGLPQISGSAGLQHFFKLRNAYLPGNSPFGFGGNNNQDPQQPQGPTPDVLVLPAIFQLPTNVEGSINASQILFNSSYIVGLQAAKTYRELSSKAAKQTRETTANNVKKAYFQNLINLERIKLFDVNIMRLDSSLRQLKALQKNGFTEQLEVDRLEVSLNNLLTEYEKTLNLLALSNLQLKFQMGMPIEQNILLTDSLSTFSATDYDVNQEPDPTNRTEYQLLKLQARGYELDLKNNRWSAMPSLVLSGSVGAFTSTKDLNLFKNRNIEVIEDFAKQPEVFTNRSLYWSYYSVAQLGLNVPIFSGFQLSNKVQQSKLNLKKAQNDIKNFEDGMKVQVQAAKVNLVNSQRSLNIQKRNMELAQRVSDNTYKKYKTGTGSNLEVTNAEAGLKEAQINYFNALYDFLISKIDYEQAAGLSNY